MYSIIDPQPSNSSETTYKVYAGNYQDKVFDRWEDGSTDSVRTLAISDDKTITAYYRANAAGPAVHMDDTTVSTGQSVWTGRLAHAEYVTEESSLVGKQINFMTMTLKKSGSPTGDGRGRHHQRGPVHEERLCDARCVNPYHVVHEL
jgi:hypothetical protein